MPLTRNQAYAVLAVVILLWGANWPVMKIGLDHITPLWFSVARFWLGALCLFAYLAASGRLVMPTRQDWPVVISVGLCHMAIFQPLTNLGLSTVEASRSVVLVYTTPLWVAPAAVLLLKERVNRLKLAGLALGLVGIAVLFNPLGVDWANPDVIIGSLLLMTAAMIWGIGILHVRAHRWQASPLQLTAWQLLFAAILTLPIAYAAEGAPRLAGSATLIGVLIYNGPIATAFCFFAATSVTRALPAITSSLSFLGVPVMGILFSVLSLGERPNLFLLAGFGLIIAGVVFVNLADRTAPRPATG